MRRLGVLAVLLCLLPASGGAAATQQVQPTTFTGYAFDACKAPPLSSLQAWTASPYRAVGVYIGGVNRACAQVNLTPSWVVSAVGLGWSLLPLYVGLQAPCISQSGLARISTSPAKAASQGLAAADDAAGDAAALGLPGGSPVYFDMEGYRLGDATCTQAVQSFVQAWVQELHARGLVAGVYGSAASTIRDVAKLAGGLPDAVWIADWNGVESLFGDPYVSDALWTNHQRLHQYKGGHKETYGGVTIDIDSSIADAPAVGGTAPPPPPPTPPPAGQVTSADGLASAAWPAAAFPVPAVVTLTTASPPPPPAGYAVTLAATESDNQAPIQGFGSPVTIHFLRPQPGAQPAFSSDGTIWTPLPRLTSAGLSGSVLTAYTLAPDGTFEVQTLVPGLFGLIPDTAPPSRPAASGRMVGNRLVLSWQPATDNVGVSAYNLLRNGTVVATLAGTARRTAVSGFSPGAPNVFRVQAADAAGNLSQPSRALVVVATRRPAGIPRAIPRWAFALLAWQQHGRRGTRPATAPRRTPDWYWRWAGWRTIPFRLR